MHIDDDEVDIYNIRLFVCLVPSWCTHEIYDGPFFSILAQECVCVCVKMQISLKSLKNIYSLKHIYLTVTLQHLSFKFRVTSSLFE